MSERISAALEFRTAAVTHSQSLSHSLTALRSFVRSFRRRWSMSWQFVHSFVRSFVRRLVGWFVRRFLGPFRSFVGSLVRSFVGSFVRSLRRCGQVGRGWTVGSGWTVDCCLVVWSVRWSVGRLVSSSIRCMVYCWTSMHRPTATRPTVLTSRRTYVLLSEGLFSEAK